MFLDVIWMNFVTTCASFVWLCTCKYGEFFAYMDLIFQSLHFPVATCACITWWDHLSHPSLDHFCAHDHNEDMCSCLLIPCLEHLGMQGLLQITFIAGNLHSHPWRIFKIANVLVSILLTTCIGFFAFIRMIIFLFLAFSNLIVSSLSWHALGLAINYALFSAKTPFFANTPSETHFASFKLFHILLWSPSLFLAACFAALLFNLSLTIQSNLILPFLHHSGYSGMKPVLSELFCKWRPGCLRSFWFSGPHPQMETAYWLMPLVQMPCWRLCWGEDDIVMSYHLLYPSLVFP